MSGGGAEPLFAPEIRQFPWIGVGVLGAATFLIEDLVVAGLFISGLVTTQAETVMGQLTSYAFVLFSAHLVPVTRTAEQVTLAGPKRLNLVLAQTDPTVPVWAYLSIPILALIGAGAIVAWHRGQRGTAWREDALVGLGLAGGYVLVGMAATVVFVTSTEFDPGRVTQTVDRLYALVATVAYPLVAGTAGALLVRAYRGYAP
jgi:uncharacterized membrane protein